MFFSHNFLIKKSIFIDEIHNLSIFEQLNAIICFENDSIT